MNQTLLKRKNSKSIVTAHVKNVQEQNVSLPEIHVQAQQANSFAELRSLLMRWKHLGVIAKILDTDDIF